MPAASRRCLPAEGADIVFCGAIDTKRKKDREREMEGKEEAELRRRRK